MKTPHTVTVIYNSFNDYGEAVSSSSLSMKCLVLDHKKVNKGGLDNPKPVFDLELLTTAKNIAPYKDLLTDNSLRFVFDDKKYYPVLVSIGYNTGGRIKFYELKMKQDANQINT